MSGDPELSGLYKGVFLYHWKEEAHHAFIDLVADVDSILQQQGREDTRYFADTIHRKLSAAETTKIGASVLSAYRWQYIF